MSKDKTESRVTGEEAIIQGFLAPLAIPLLILGVPILDTLFAIVTPAQLRRLLDRTFDEAEFLSPHGIRSVSAIHRSHPFTIALDGQSFRVDYEPGESTTALFGGNSNWRGPVWMPLNVLIVESLRRFDRHLGSAFTVLMPADDGRDVTLAEAADELSHRLVSLLIPDDAGRLPAAGSRSWPSGLLLFHEYFHGDTGEGLGASHQTGWTALAAHLVLTAPAGAAASPAPAGAAPSKS